MALKPQDQVKDLNKSTFLVHDLDGELVLDSFFMHALIRDKTKSQIVLQLPHNGTHGARLTMALDERNLRVAGTGQEMWGHACKDCAKIYTGADGLVCKSAWLQMSD